MFEMFNTFIYYSPLYKYFSLKIILTEPIINLFKSAGKESYCLQRLYYIHLNERAAINCSSNFGSL